MENWFGEPHIRQMEYAYPDICARKKKMNGKIRKKEKKNPKIWFQRSTENPHTQM